MDYSDSEFATLTAVTAYGCFSTSETSVALAFATDCPNRKQPASHLRKISKYQVASALQDT